MRWKGWAAQAQADARLQATQEMRINAEKAWKDAMAEHALAFARGRASYAENLAKFEAEEEAEKAALDLLEINGKDRKKCFRVSCITWILLLPLFDIVFRFLPFLSPFPSVWVAF